MPSSGKIDINHIDLGIEYSFRFPDQPRSEASAREELRASAEAFLDALGGGTVEELETGGHGHGLSVRFLVTDPKGQTWRVEWDGINRSYEDGVAKECGTDTLKFPHRKKLPKTWMKWRRSTLPPCRTWGENHVEGRRGAHINMDLKIHSFQLAPEVGARKLANLIALFESHRPVFQFLWQHPYRLRAARGAELTLPFIKRLDDFSGDWNALGKMLYEERYFNPYITRKPAYLQLNVTGVMNPFVPEKYRQTIDIKNPEVQWFPAFGGKGTDRIEFRLFDAPPDLVLASLQIKYLQAFL